MKKAPGRKPAGDRVAAVVSALSLTLIAAVLLAFYRLTGYQSLLLTGLIALLPAFINLALLLPVAKPLAVQEAPAPAPEEAQPQKQTRVRRRKGKLRAFWVKRRSVVLAVLMLIGGMAMSLLFWKRLPIQPGESTLNYLYPVVLVALFVVAIVLETWCKHAGRQEEDAQQPNRYAGALLKNLRSALALSRIALLLTAAAMMLKLLNIYDAQQILKILLAVLFAYETVFLLLSLAVRLIRHEMDTAPEFLVSVPGMGGSDLNILSYLEENTGITMRSLWSMQVVKRVLPVAAMVVLLLLWASTCMVEIQAHQEGALYRVGRLQQETLTPGIHLTLPWPFDRVEIYDTKTIQRAAIGYAVTEEKDHLWTDVHDGDEYCLLLGNGNEMISINLAIEYRISDLYSYLRSSAHPEALLQAAAYEIVTERTISTDLETMLAADRAAFSQTFRQELAERMDAGHLGIEVVSVVMENMHPPVAVAGAYQKAVSAEIMAEQILLMAQREANARLTAAKNQYISDVGDAQVRQYQTVAAARSAVAEFMAGAGADSEYRDAYRYYKYMNAIKRAYSDTNLVIVGDGIDTSNIYLGNLEEANPTEPTVHVDDDEVDEEAGLKPEDYNDMELN